MNKQQVLKKYFGYDSFRKGQEVLIDNILDGRDILGIMPTGAGKSLCYQVPALMLPGITLVISPLISLMKDQVQALNQAGIHAAYINSSLTDKQISKALQLASNGQYKIIYIAPERLETYEFKNFAMNTEISMVTVDEAHCISQWGQDFRPSYLNVTKFVTCLPSRPIVTSFTATATNKVKEDILKVLNLRNPFTLVTGFDRKNLYFGVEKPKNKDQFIKEYMKEHPGDSGIIYCATRKNVDALCAMLEEEGLAVTKYHAGLGDRERVENQDDFIYDRKPIIVATNAFGMGIDKSNVRFVLHYNMPQSLENYYQEAGRAGRDGGIAECILLYSPQDVLINRFLLDSKEGNQELRSDESTNIRERDEERLKLMTYYSITPHCQREYILRYFNEEGKTECNNCSNCLKEFEKIDVTETTKKIIACIKECGERFGIQVIAGILCGSNSAKLKEYRVSSVKSFGILGDMSEARIKHILNQLLVDGILYLTNSKYTIIKLTSNAYEVMEGSKQVVFKIAEDSVEDKKETSKKEGVKQILQISTNALNERGLELFQELRLLRSMIAKEEKMPPYIIFSDKTLMDMCMKTPLNREQMLQVLGVGENKYEKYGERFLEQILKYTDGEKEQLYYDIKPDKLNSSVGKTSKETKSKVAKEEFYITSDMAEKIVYSDSCLISELVNQLNEIRNQDEVKRISGASLVRFMTEEGLLLETAKDGKWMKHVTRKGSELDIKIGTRISAKGTEYDDYYYGKKAQMMIVQSLIK